MTWFSPACLALMLMLRGIAGALIQTPAQTPQPPGRETATQSPENSPAAQAQPPAPLPKAQFFAGTVTALDQHHITISRTAPGKAPERRTFLINLKTKMRSSVKLKSRVTVRYRHLPEGDVALEIQLRPLHIPRAS